MARKVRAKCKHCGETVYPSGYGKGKGRNAHLKEKHPEATGGYRENFDLVDLDLGKKQKAQKKKIVKKEKPIKPSKELAIVPEPTTLPA